MGVTEELALVDIREAADEFIKVGREIGTLEDILREAGFKRLDKTWSRPKVVSLETLTINLT
jgi:hypothetical protein